MTDRDSRQADQDARTATHSANDDTAHSIQSATHALSERLTAMTNYFGAVRGSLNKGDHEAAHQMILRVLEQGERARQLAEQLRTLMKERLP